MLIHQYDSVTGQYIQSGLADVDPKSPERWLIPAFSTSAALPERLPYTWPFLVGGKWELRPDHRGQTLYRQDTGEQAEILVAGVAPEEAGLTVKPRPSGEHRWNGSSWELSAEAVAEKQKMNAMAEFERRLDIARKKNAGKNDAFAADLLTPQEAALFKAWAAYQMDLVRQVSAEDFPKNCVWPEEPDEAEIAAQVEAEAEAEQTE
ncbi:hypothetical protein FQZ97_641880 [compost metagenome]